MQNQKHKVEPITLTIPIRSNQTRPFAFLGKLLGRQLPQPTERTFEFYPSIITNMQRIAKRAIEIPGLLVEQSTEHAILKLIGEHADNITYIIAAGIQNNAKEPERKLIAFIKRNFNHDDMFEAVNITLDCLGFQSIVNCMILIKGHKAIINPEVEAIKEVAEPEHLPGLENFISRFDEQAVNNHIETN